MAVLHGKVPPIVLFIALAGLATPDGLRAQELRDADDVLWLLDRDRRNLSAEYQRILTALDASKVPNADRARDIAIRFKLAHGGLRAEDSASGEVRTVLPVDDR